MSKWMIRLTGDANDLQVLSQHLSSPELSVRKEEDGYFWLSSSKFDLLTDAFLVAAKAGELLGVVSGVAKLLGNLNPVEEDAIIRKEENKPPTQFILLRGVPSDERLPMSQAQFARLLSLAEQDQRVADALYFFQKADWYNLYKVWDVINYAVGGSLKKEKWVNKTDANRFTKTAQSRKAIGDEARHGVDKNDPPKGGYMNIFEAQEFVKGLLYKWVRNNM